MQVNPTYQSVLTNYSDRLLGILLTGLSKIDETQPEELEDGDENNLTTLIVSGISLEHLAHVLKDTILDKTIEFALSKVGSQVWQERQVGFLALGAVLDGPDPAKYQHKMMGCFGAILESMKDPMPKVKKSIAWVIYRTAEFNF